MRPIIGIHSLHYSKGLGLQKRWLLGLFLVCRFSLLQASDPAQLLEFRHCQVPYERYIQARGSEKDVAKMLRLINISQEYFREDRSLRQASRADADGIDDSFLASTAFDLIAAHKKRIDVRMLAALVSSFCREGQFSRLPGQTPLGYSSFIQGFLGMVAQNRIHLEDSLHGHLETIAGNIVFEQPWQQVIQVAENTAEAKDIFTNFMTSRDSLRLQSARARLLELWELLPLVPSQEQKARREVRRLQAQVDQAELSVVQPAIEWVLRLEPEVKTILALEKEYVRTGVSILILRSRAIRHFAMRGAIDESIQELFKLPQGLGMPIVSLRDIGRVCLEGLYEGLQAYLVISEPEPEQTKIRAIVKHVKNIEKNLDLKGDSEAKIYLRKRLRLALSSREANTLNRMQANLSMKKRMYPLNNDAGAKELSGGMFDRFRGKSACSICCDDFALKELRKCTRKRCKILLCADCMKDFLKEESKKPFGIPFCCTLCSSNKIETKMNFTENDLKQWGFGKDFIHAWRKKVIVDAFVKEFPDHAACTTEDCMSLIPAEKVDKDGHYTCDSCEETLCRYCGNNHRIDKGICPKSAEAADKDYFAKRLKDKDLKTCPGCQMAIEKEVLTDCNRIWCIQCKKNYRWNPDTDEFEPWHDYAYHNERGETWKGVQGHD